MQPIPTNSESEQKKTKKDNSYSKDKLLILSVNTELLIFHLLTEVISSKDLEVSKSVYKSELNSLILS